VSVSSPGDKLAQMLGSQAALPDLGPHQKGMLCPNNHSKLTSIQTFLDAQYTYVTVNFTHSCKHKDTKTDMEILESQQDVSVFVLFFVSLL
jgi:hypothetical protein